MILSLIVAASENNVIGKQGDLPWNLPAELKYYRSKTLGKPNIMGRRTHEGIGKPLPKRHNIVVSRTPGYTAEGCDVVSSIREGIELAKKDNIDEAFIIGGEGIFREALPIADRLYFTRVHTTIEGGDTFFPDFDVADWNEVSKTEHPVDAENSISFTMYVYERKK
jgi:dihydrofolate reductase